VEHLDTALDTMLSTAKDQLRHVAGAVGDRTGHREQSQSITIGCPQESVQQLFQDSGRLSEVLGDIAEVRKTTADNRMCWVFRQGPLDGTAWESLLIADTGRLRFIDAKRNGGGGNEITFDFSDAPRGMGTEVTLRVKSPVPGLLSGALAYKALYRARALLQTEKYRPSEKIPARVSPLAEPSRSTNASPVLERNQRPAGRNGLRSRVHGEVVEVGPDVTNTRVGDRVVVPSFIACNHCWYCEHDMPSLCDTTNPNAELQQPLLGYPSGGIYGYTHPFGGYRDSHAQYIRVPFGDANCFAIPDFVTDEQALFLSDAVPTGYMGADFCELNTGDTVAVFGAGGVGLMAARSALLSGADRVISIDRIPERLELAQKLGAETIDYTAVDSVQETLREANGGRGPDACIDAVGMEGHGTGVQQLCDRAKQLLRLEPTGRLRCGKPSWPVARAASLQCSVCTA
jgi:NADPH:quinone reductase-like Zn-dependent oxidoreductase